MSQVDYTISDQSGASFRADLNTTLAAIVSQNSGATEPSTTFAYQWWADTTTGILKMRNAANSAWISLFTIATGAWLGNAATATVATTATTANGVTASLTGILRADAGVLSIGAPFLAFTTITATNAAWAPNALTKKMLVCCIGGGGGGGGKQASGGFGGEGGRQGTINWGYISSVSGTYNAVIGAGGAGGSGNGTIGGTTSFGAAASAVGGIGGTANIYTGNGFGGSGESFVGNGAQGSNGGNGAAAGANSAAGGAGAGHISASAYTGGNGGSGIIYVFEFS